MKVCGFAAHFQLAVLLNFRIATNLAGETMYIAIEGVIGVGKTTLARLLQPAFDADLLLEVFEENPFLSDFTATGPATPSRPDLLPAQPLPAATAWGHNHPRGRQIAALRLYLCKDSLFARINLKGDELESTSASTRRWPKKISMPDLLVYLRADTDVLMQRIGSTRPFI